MIGNYEDRNYAIWRVECDHCGKKEEKKLEKTSEYGKYEDENYLGTWTRLFVGMRPSKLSSGRQIAVTGCCKQHALAELNKQLEGFVFSEE